MLRILGNLYRNSFLVCVCILLCACYYFSVVDRAHVELKINVEKRTFFRIFWAEKDGHFTESKHAGVLVQPGGHVYSLYLTDIKDIERLRIDPQEYIGKSEIVCLVIFQRGFEKIDLGASGFRTLQPTWHVGHSGVADDKLVTVSTGNDPQYVYKVLLTPVQFGWLGETVRLLLLFAVLYFAGKASGRILPKERYIPFLLVGTVGLILTMAMLSKRNVHPDEYVHLAAAEYYSENWLPPAVDSDEVRHTCSRYGVSRLNGREIYYFIAGKFHALFSPLQLTDYQMFRLFNVLLLVTILFVAVRHVQSRIVVAVLLISPQLWYVFSYCNSDAFAVFLGLLAGWQVVDRQSLLYRYLDDTEQDRGFQLKAIVLLGILFGMLLLIKKNYYPMIALFFLVLLERLWNRRHYIDFRSVAVKILILIVAGVSLLVVRLGVDMAMDGLDRPQKIEAIRTEVALPMFNPATLVQKRNIYLSMKERGVPLKNIIYDHHWFEKTFRSAFGVYGYMSVSASNYIYDLFRWTALSMLVYLVGSILVAGNWSERLLMAGALGLSAILVGASLYHSWINDFQAQGRYLFPVAVMIATVSAAAESALHRKTLCLFITVLFVLSAYSFLLVGISGFFGSGWV